MSMCDTMRYHTPTARRQEVHGYRGQPPVADCVEACAREALGLELWDGEGYTNYLKWGDLIGRLATLYPHLVAVDM